jgi:hypothetical protein
VGVASGTGGNGDGVEGILPWPIQPGAVSAVPAMPIASRIASIPDVAALLSQRFTDLR